LLIPFGASSQQLRRFILFALPAFCSAFCRGNFLFIFLLRSVFRYLLSTWKDRHRLEACALVLEQILKGRFLPARAAFFPASGSNHSWKAQG